MQQDSPSPIRVLIVDDHAVVRAGLRMLIDSQPSMTVVAEAGTRAESVQAAAREQPDIVLLDLDMGGESGLSFLPDLAGAARKARILVLTGVRDPEAHRKAVRASVSCSREYATLKRTGRQCAPAPGAWFSRKRQWRC